MYVYLACYVHALYFVDVICVVYVINVLYVANVSGKLASLNCSWQSKEGTYRALGMTGIEPTSSKSKDWTRFRLNHSAKGAVSICIKCNVQITTIYMWNMLNM